MEASWNALGALLEAFGAQTSNWKRLLDGPRPPRRPVSACLGAKYPWGALGAKKPPNINLAIMEREAGDAENVKHCKTIKAATKAREARPYVSCEAFVEHCNWRKGRNQRKKSKSTHSRNPARLGFRGWALARALGRLELDISV